MLMEERIKYYEMLMDYLDKYGDQYPNVALEEFNTNFLNPCVKLRDSSDVLNQIYELFGIFEHNKDNAYDIFINHMTKRMDINRKLLDVGCGCYPSLASRIAKIQKYGSVTAIDPRVVTTDVQGITVIKDKFTLESQFTEFDMLYGMYPCDATVSMIKFANIYDIDLCILACNCCDTPLGKMNNMKMWLKYIESVIKESIPRGRIYKIENVRSLNRPLITIKR